MSVPYTLMTVLTFVLTPLDPTHAAVELDTDYQAMDALAKVYTYHNNVRKTKKNYILHFNL